MEIAFDEASEKAKELLRLINKQPLSAEGLVLVLGGDGTMLNTAHQFGFWPVFLGINCGHKGFLMNDASDALDIANRIVSKEFRVLQFPLLSIEAENGWKGLAMGDVYFNRITGQTCKVNVRVNGVEIAQRISGDGIVICTALGSAGYFAPAGGSVMHPMVEAIGFAAIVRNMPIQLVPMVFPLISEIEVTLLSPQEEVKGWHDGIELPYFKKLRIKRSERMVRLAFWEDENFTARMVRKIMRVPEEA